MMQTFGMNVSSAMLFELVKIPGKPSRTTVDAAVGMPAAADPSPAR